MRAPGGAAGARCWHERALSAPTRVVDTLHGISAPTRVVDTSARYIPLAVSTTPSRCRRPPRGADSARPYRQRALELAPGPTTRVHAGGNTAPGPRAADTADNARCPGGAPALRPSALWTRPTTPAPGPGPRPTAPDRAPPPRSTHTRTPIHETRTAHKGGIKPLCAAQCCVIPSLVCDTSGHGHRKRTERRDGPTTR